MRRTFLDAISRIDARTFPERTIQSRVGRSDRRSGQSAGGTFSEKIDIDRASRRSDRGLVRRLAPKPPRHAVGSKRVHEHSAEQTNIGNCEQDRDVESGDDARKPQAGAENAVKDYGVDVRGEAQIDTFQPIRRIQKNQYPSQTYHDEKVVFVHPRIEYEVTHVAEHRVAD